jgi:hypothetical protein
VRVAPRPRSEIVLAPGPPSVTKPPKRVDLRGARRRAHDCRAAVVEAKPDIRVSSRVITCTGEAELKLSRRMREPVTVIFSLACACDSIETRASMPAATTTSRVTPSAVTR